MKITLKQFLTFLVILFIYFLPGIIFPFDSAFYKGLNGFKLPSWIFGLVWSIVYILVALLITYHIYHKKEDLSDGSYKRFFTFLIINYFLMASFGLVFFKLHNLFLAYISCLFTFVTILLSIMEAALIHKKSSLLLLPYVVWSLIASILSIMIYLEN